MTVEQWHRENAERNSHRADLVVQLACARYRSAAGDGRWPSVKTAIKEMDATTGVPNGEQYERFWRSYMNRASEIARSLKWDKAEIMADGGWRQGGGQ